MGGLTRLHCGYHKCLTMFSRRIYKRACWTSVFPPRLFRHYFHDLQKFRREYRGFRINSISGHALDPDEFGDVRIVRFIRDPRDLLVSGYFYHKRGAEYWCKIENPKEGDWGIVRGRVPSCLPADTSLEAYLNAVPEADGLRAEYEFRQYHFASMREWALDDPRIRVYRYEDILGREIDVFGEIFDFMEMPVIAKAAGQLYARRTRAASGRNRNAHIRNPKSGQWRDKVPQDVVEAFARDYGDVLERYGYPLR